MSIDWSSTVSWVDVLASVGTVLAVVVALWFGWAEVHRFRREQSTRDDRLRREQATRVAAWMEVLEHPVDVPYIDGVGGQPHVINASASPVYEVTLEFEALDDGAQYERETWYVGILPPGAERVGRRSEVRIFEDSPLTCSYRDIDGNWWVHTEAGYVLPISKNPHEDD